MFEFFKARVTLTSLPTIVSPANLTPISKLIPRFLKARSRSLLLDSSSNHEQVHVAQYERWGVFFVPGYLLSSAWQTASRRHAVRVLLDAGCFWHGHPGCAKWRLPKTNRGYWQAKIGRNRERDAKNLPPAAAG